MWWVGGMFGPLFLVNNCVFVGWEGSRWQDIKYSTFHAEISAIFGDIRVVEGGV